MRRGTILGASIAAALCGVAAAALPGVAVAADVSWERLLNPEPENWLLYGGNLAGWRYSELDTINKENAGDLQVKYIFTLKGEDNDSELNGREESVLLVDNGTLFVTDSLARVSSWDVSSGEKAVPLWSYDPVITKSRTQRGIALFDDGVFIGTNDTRLIRINSDTGELVWEVKGGADPIPEYGTPSPAAKQGFTTEPIVIKSSGGKDLVIQGESTGGQQGTISYVVAADAASGDIAWRRFTVPFPGEPGHETWADDHDAWKTGGAGVWSHATFDPETNLIYHGTGDIFPSFDPEFRPGDNLFGASTIAIDADTGAFNWYHQLVPNESFDWDQPGTRMLYDAADGTKVAGVFSRAGHYYTYNRANGELLNVFTWYAGTNWTAGIDVKTGLPVDYVPGAGVQKYAGLRPNRGGTGGESCPNWSNSVMGMNPSGFDPNSRTAYLEATDGCAGAVTEFKAWADDVAAQASAGLSRIGNPAGTTLTRAAPSVPNVYSVYAYNVDTGELAAKFEDPETTTPPGSGVLVTAGGLVVSGSGQGDIRVLDAATLEELYKFNSGSEISAPASTWSVDGKQYIGIVTGSDGGNGLNGAATVVVLGLPG